MKRASGLDLLRAIAIAWVMLFHSFIIDGWHEPFVGMESNGWMGVDLFFVLSGYLIGSQLLRPLSLGQPLSLIDFYLRRAFRILPVFFVVLALYFLWPPFRESGGIQPLWQFLTFTVNLLIDYQHNKAFSHVWSLCVEEHFYLLFPLLAWWMTRRPSVTKFVVVVVCVVIAGMALRGFLWMHELAPVSTGDDPRMGPRFVEYIYYPTWSRLDGLLAGVVLATIRIYRPAIWACLQARANLASLAGIVVTAMALLIFRDRSGLLASVLGYPMLSLGFALLVLAGAGRRGWLATVRVPGAHWVAAISYSLYLSHKAVLHLANQALAPHLDGHPAAAFVVYALAMFTSGAALYYGIERPFLRLRARLRLAPKTGALMAVSLNDRPGDEPRSPGTPDL
jgi:peptidoglycan/LPS O-acetylase OafA/YrhL